MEIGKFKSPRTVRFALLTSVLALMAVVLCALLFITLRATLRAAPDLRDYLGRLAWLCLAMLLLTLLGLVWIVVRYAIHRTRPPSRHEPTEYVDAWAIAGKRFKLQDGDLDEPAESDNDTSG